MSEENMDWDKQLLSKPTNDQDEQFKLETMGGDTTLTHLMMQIDRAIRKKELSKEDDNAQFYRYWHGRLLPFKYLTLLVYAFLTQVEQPNWCIRNLRL